MNLFLKLVAAVALIAACVTAQNPYWNGDSLPKVVASSIVWQSIEADGTIVSMHENGVLTFATVDSEGTFHASFAGTTRDVESMQGPIGATDPVPTLRTSWCDKAGVTHEVVTPIVSTTDAGLDRATDLHDKLVARMQAKHPPRPCPPP